MRSKKTGFLKNKKGLMRLIRIFASMVFLCHCNSVSAQNTETDSLKKLLVTAREDLNHVNILESLSYAYLSSYPDTALQYALKGLQLAKKIGSLNGEAICLNAIGNVYFQTGDNVRALEMYLRYLKLKETLKDFNNLNIAYFNIASAYTEQKDYRHALFYLFQAKKEDEKAKDTAAILYDLYSLGSIYLRMGETDSALYYINQSYQLAEYTNDRNMKGAILNVFGEAYLALDNTEEAKKYYNLSIAYTEAVKDYEVLSVDYYGLSRIYKGKDMLDSSIYYARKAFYIAHEAPYYRQALETSVFLSDLFKMQKKFDSAFHYQALSIAIKDSLFSEEQVRKVQDMKFEEQVRQQSVETEKIRYRSAIRLFVVIFISGIFLAIAGLLWRSNRQKQTANALLQQQKDKVESTLSELRSTQALLIQSEKMASLGELTAGIAHEIQNPLNFVNNFSDVSNELIDEMKGEILKGNYDDVEQISNDLKHNLEKINHHGKRADSIVKGMLEHSRTNSGKKVPADINSLCDEYLRLAYHGLRAKDKTFNAVSKTEFDSNIGKVSIVPQEIGRVILNLINNAFYAVHKKQQQNIPGYEPTVIVTTKKLAGNAGGHSVEIAVSDNGTGIPQNLVDKIFQPFFTTKPTGEGTGLGLSLSYDIVKAHGGQLRVETKEGEGSTFFILLNRS
jgi:two-component system NtrC family sensor kinase